MDINMKMEQIADKLNNISNMTGYDKNKKDYDKVGFTYDLEYTVKQLEFFFDEVVPKKTGNSKTSFYIPCKVPTEHQIAYYNLTRGFPKELFGGHFCYVLKCFKYKHLVIPTTSITSRDSKLNPDFEMDIEIENFINDNATRLQLTDIRCIDIQRLYVNKGFYDVKSPREDIIKKVSNTIF